MIKDFDNCKEMNDEQWKSGLLLFLRSKQYVNLHCLEIIENALEEYADRQVNKLKVWLYFHLYRRSYYLILLPIVRLYHL
jgi:hypothetical protein